MFAAVGVVRAFHDNSISEDTYMLGIEPAEWPIMNILMRLWA